MHCELFRWIVKRKNLLENFISLKFEREREVWGSLIARETKFREEIMNCYNYSTNFLTSFQVTCACINSTCAMLEVHIKHL